ncbi:Phosphoinositide phosphatase sac1, partial [Tieghemiomyces parasiticus]
MLHQEFKLHVLKDVVVVEPNVLGQQPTSLVFQRSSGDITEVRGYPTANGATEEVIPIFGILGAVRFLGGYHLVVISGRDKVGSFRGHDIYRIKETKVVAFDPTMSQLSADQ